ncbi:MAG: hypothetical protein RL722_444 [Pseudomonadota bacterium]
MMPPRGRSRLDVGSAAVATTAAAAMIVASIIAAIVPSVTMVVVMAAVAPAVMTVAMIIAPALAAVDVVAVPVIAHEIDRHAAGPVFAAMPLPVAAVFKRYPEVDRLGAWKAGWRGNDHWLGHVDLWGRAVADVHPAIDAGLADLD